MLSINFYNRHALGGIAVYTMLPVRWLTGLYVHCDVTVGGVVWTADMRRGVTCSKSTLIPTKSLDLPWIRDDCAAQAAEELKGTHYSLLDFLTVALPDALKRNHKGMICSEHVALVLRRACELSEPLSRGPAKARCRSLADLLYAIEPHRQTPTSLQRVLNLWNGIQS